MFVCVVWRVARGPWSLFSDRALLLLYIYFLFETNEVDKRLRTEEPNTRHGKKYLVVISTSSCRNPTQDFQRRKSPTRAAFDQPRFFCSMTMVAKKAYSVSIIHKEVLVLKLKSNQAIVERSYCSRQRGENRCNDRVVE